MPGRRGTGGPLCRPCLDGLRMSAWLQKADVGADVAAVRFVPIAAITHRSISRPGVAAKIVQCRGHWST